jgi:C4-dicarboxylate-binding protein DctP
LPDYSRRRTISRAGKQLAHATPRRGRRIDEDAAKRPRAPCDVSFVGNRRKIPIAASLARSAIRAMRGTLGRGAKRRQQSRIGGTSMTRKITRRSAVALAATAPLAMATRGFGQSPIVIKFSHVVANDTPKGKGSLKFKELAEKYTDGKVKIEVYPNSSLYKDKEEIEALQLGSVQMLAPSTAKFAPLGVKEFEALDLPWLFKNDQVYTNAMKGQVGQWLFAKLETKGIKGLAYWDNGFHMVSANRPLLAPTDFQGLKIRISGSKIADQYFRELGSIPQIMAFSEVYQALQTGVVDGCENTASNYLTQKFHEVQKHITISYHAHLQYAVIVNTKFWNGLPADIRPQLDKAMAEATDYTNSIARQENEDSLAAIKASGKTTLHDLSDDQRKAWQVAMAPTYKWAKGRVGQEVLDLLVKELNLQI